MLRVSSGLQDFTLCRWHECVDCTPLFAFRRAGEVLAWLHMFKSEVSTMAALRQAALELGDLPDLVERSDEQVLAELAHLIESGRLQLCASAGEASHGGGGGGAPVPPPAPPPVPVPPPPRPRPPPPPPPVDPKGNLFVEVYDDAGKLITEEVEITATGPQSLQAVVKAGSHTFTGVNLGTYSVKAAVPKDFFDTNSKSTGSTPVPAGGTGKARLDFKWLLNVVTPKIEVEYKVVMLDRGLSTHQPGGEAPLRADNVTYIEVSASETTGAPPYTGAGGSFQASPANVDVFTDKDCTKPLAGKIAKADLFAGPVKLFLRAKTAGKFTAKLTMDPSGNPRVRVEGPAQEEMGVVELKLLVHEHDIPAIQAKKVDPDTEPIGTYHTKLKDEALPAQKALTDAQKVNPGRMVHLQNAGHHARAKVVLAKLDAGQWPGGTDDYDITLAAVGGLALHGKEVDADAKAAPLSFKVSALKAAEQTLWAEGNAASAALRDARLELGLDRAAGGLAKTAKARGDWGCFSVVKIEELKINYTKAADEHQAWDEAQKRYYININKKGDADGRKVKFKARLSAKLAGVPLRFMLAPDKDNTKAANWNIDFPTDGKSGATDVKWKDVPAAIKHKDKADRKDLLHLRAVTDAEGSAEVELQLSRCGGDKFHPGVYIEQDPHLCKYVHGDAELAKREPKFAAVTPVQVWRKTFYQVTRPKDTAMAAMGGFDTSQRKVFLEPVFTSVNTMDASNFTINPYRPAWQFQAGAGDKAMLCIGMHNSTEATAMFTPEEKDTAPKFHLILCDEQFDAVTSAGNSIQTGFVHYDFTAAASGARDVRLTSSSLESHMLTITDPPLQGGALIVRAQWQQLTFAAGAWATGAAQDLPAANVKVQKTRAAKNRVNLTPPAAGVIDANNIVRVWLQLQAADGPYLGWAPSGSVASVVKGGRPDSSIQDVAAHEMGHLFGKARVNSIAGIPDHKFFYQKRGGSGSHCAFGATWTPDASAPALDPTKANERDAQGNGAGAYSDGGCIMFGIGSDHKVEWCKHCALDFILSDMSKFG